MRHPKSLRTGLFVHPRGRLSDETRWTKLNHMPSSIRAFILGLCAILAAVELPAQPIPSRYAFGVTLPQYVSMSASNTAQGYRPISLDANGSTNAPDIAAVWIADGLTNWTTVLGVTSTEYSNQVALLSGQGYRTLCVDPYGVYPNERYVAVWVKDAQVTAGWAQVFNLSEADYNTAWNNYANSGYRPIWISVLASNSAPRFSGAWVKDGLGFWTYWNMNATGLGQTLTNILGQGGRPISLAGYSPSGSTLFAGHWIYAEQPVWTWNSELTADRKSTRLNSSHPQLSRMPSSA